MSSSLAITALIILGATVVLYLLISRKLDQAMKDRGEDAATRLINDNIQKMNDRLNDRLTEAARYIGSLGQELRSMQDIGKNINDLRSAFFSPKLRGNFGERVLQDMLEAHFPREQYEIQHKFKDGQTVDAILKTKDGSIPVDSKFPVDNYRKMVAANSEEERAFERNEFQKAVRKHITDIAKKYILPGEGTMSFAIMYVPSEGIFYEIISSTDELTDLAARQKVLLASPNTMSYFLHVLRLGHERIRIEENVQKVWEMLAGFHQETAKFGENLSVLARHVTQAKNAMDSVSNEYGKLASRIDQIKQLK